MLQRPLSSGTNRANSLFPGSANGNLRMCTSFPRSGASDSALSPTQAMGRIMSASVTLPVAIASSLALISLGGGVYESLVIDPFWPRRPDIIQPQSRWDIAKAVLDTCSHGVRTGPHSGSRDGMVVGGSLLAAGRF